MVKWLVLLLMLLPHTIGRLTASGTTYDGREYTLAHRDLAFGTLVRVVVRETGHSIKAKVTDRGPYCQYPGSYYYSCKQRRIVDVSERVAEELRFKKQGVAYVSLSVLDID